MINYNSWNFTKKLIKVGHNRAVRSHFRDIKSDSRRDTGRTALKTGLLIDDKDSALEILNKQIYFRLGLQREEAVGTNPWAWSTKPMPDNPQLCVVYRMKNNRKSGNYPLYIPNYNGSKSFNPPEFKKGTRMAYVILNDNSRVSCNAFSELEAEKVVKYFLRFVNSRFRNNDIRHTKVNANYIVADMKPVRADFYSKGPINSTPDWRLYF
ncbi:MAG: hypothetical protein RH949_13290 [Coleofasciculus sp. A1-SPW-01]|uniref:hypothetical protein n=1 Tax=Coleofasciculus sp. A1-SPW-01 TaxID=3070819 RepID=UPI0032F6AEF1